jgi:hypothetical protein
MEYRSIRYTIRARTERGQWKVAIHPAGIESTGKVISGSRAQAERMARSMIDKWLSEGSASERLPTIET